MMWLIQEKSNFLRTQQPRHAHAQESVGQGKCDNRCIRCRLHRVLDSSTSFMKNKQGSIYYAAFLRPLTLLHVSVSKVADVKVFSRT